MPIIINGVLSMSSGCVRIFNLTQETVISVTFILLLLFSQKDALRIYMWRISEFRFSSIPAFRPIYVFRVYLGFRPHPHIKRYLSAFPCFGVNYV